MNKILIRGGLVFDHTGDIDQPQVNDILVEGSIIREVGRNLTFCESDTKIFSAHGKLILPGFVNAHYHSHDVFARGLFEGKPLEIWTFFSSPQNYAPRSLREVRARTLLGAVECLHNGITTIQDMNIVWPPSEEYVDAVLNAYKEAGIRVVYCMNIADLPAIETVPYLKAMLPEDAKERVGKRDMGVPDLLSFVEDLVISHPSGERFSWAIGPSGPQRCSRGLLEGVAEMAERLDLPIFTHLYETKAQALQARIKYVEHGGSLVDYLSDVGLLGPRLTVAHGVWLNDREISRLAETDTGVILNLLSNLKLKSGIAPIFRLWQKGVRLALGGDNCSCSDVQSMFEAMKMFCLLGAVSDPEPGGIAAADAIRVATEGGSRALRRSKEIGAIRSGMKADLVLFNLKDIAFVPFNSAARQVVYSANRCSVDTVLVDGRIVKEDGKIKTVDEDSLQCEISELMEPFRLETIKIAEANSAMLPYLHAVHRRVWKQDVGIHRYVGPLDVTEDET